MSPNTRSSTSRLPQDPESGPHVEMRETAEPTGDTTGTPATDPLRPPPDMEGAGENPEQEEERAQERELEILERRVNFARKKAELLQKLRDHNHTAATLEAETQATEPGAPDIPRENLTAPPTRIYTIASSSTSEDPPPRELIDAQLRLQELARGKQEPRAPSNIKLYEGRSTDEWNAFKAANEAFWDRHPEWYSTDHARVMRVSEFLSGAKNNDWMQYRKNNPTLDVTWALFEEWALSQVADPAKLQRDTMSNWWRHTQKETQSVNDYANHMTSLYNTLKNRPTRQERVQRLCTGILREIELEGRRFPEPTTDIWDDWVKYYNMVEQQMPTRQAVLRNKKRDDGKREPIAKPYPQRSWREARPYPQKSWGEKRKQNGDTQRPWHARSRNTDSGTPDQTGGAEKRKFEGSDPAVCYFCKKRGHIARDCWTKAKSESKK